MAHGERHHAPATRRNREPILAVLERILPCSGVVLEIGSGSGEHACWFAPRIPRLEWQPSDADPDKLASIAIWATEAEGGTIRPPLLLDATGDDWPIEGPIAAIICINMVHVAPWRACEGLLRGAGRLLPRGGLFYLYGPFRRGETPTAPSNEAFDKSLRAAKPSWGLRHLDDVVAIAVENGFELNEVVEMPASNLSAILVRR